jgi:hypothetical protein
MWMWWATMVVVSIILVTNAVVAWKECRTMFDFVLVVPAALRPPLRPA